MDSLPLVHGVEIAQIQLFTMNMATDTFIYIYVHEIKERVDVVRRKVCYWLDNRQWPHHRHRWGKGQPRPPFPVTHWSCHNWRLNLGGYVAMFPASHPTLLWLACSAEKVGRAWCLSHMWAWYDCKGWLSCWWIESFVNSPNLKKLSKGNILGFQVQVSTNCMFNVQVYDNHPC